MFTQSSHSSRVLLQNETKENFCELPFVTGIPSSGVFIASTKTKQKVVRETQKMFGRQLMTAHLVRTRQRQKHLFQHSRGLVRHSASHLLQPWSLPPPKADPSSQSSRSHRLLVEHGFVRSVPNCAGMFYLLPLAMRQVDPGSSESRHFLGCLNLNLSAGA